MLLALGTFFSATLFLFAEQGVFAPAPLPYLHTFGHSLLYSAPHSAPVFPPPASSALCGSFADKLQLAVIASLLLFRALCSVFSIIHGFFSLQGFTSVELSHKVSYS